MAKVSIKILGTWPAWDAVARAGEITRPDGTTVPVLLHVDPRSAPASVEAARVEGRAIGLISHRQVLHVKQVLSGGSAPMWVHDAFEGASLARVGAELLAQGRRLPVRAVLEIAGVIVDVTGEVWSHSLERGSPVVHPGVTPASVLMSPRGELRVAGFRAPAAGCQVASPAGYGPPEGGHGAPAMVYGVAALICELLTGEVPPGSATDPERHQAAVRRSLIRVLSRPGGRVPEPVVDLLRRCLAFEPAKRPSLPKLAVELSRLVDGLPQAPLADWAAVAMPRLWMRLTAAQLDLADAAAPPVRTMSMAVGPLPTRPRPGPVAASGPADPAAVIPAARAKEGGVPDTAEVEPVGRLTAAGNRALGGVAVPVGTIEVDAALHSPLARGGAGDNETEEVERTQEVAEAAPEVTVSTPSSSGLLADGGSAAAGDTRPFGLALPHSLGAAGPAGPTGAVGISDGGVVEPLRFGHGDSAAAGAPGATRDIDEDEDYLDWRPARRFPWLTVVAFGGLLLVGALVWVQRQQGSLVVPPDTPAADVAGPTTNSGAVVVTEVPPAVLPPAAVPPAVLPPAAVPPAVVLPAVVLPAVVLPAVVPPAVVLPTAVPAAAVRQTAVLPAAAVRETAVVPAVVDVTSAGRAKVEPILPPEVEVELPAPPPYTLTFESGYAGLAHMAVTCHGGRSGSGLKVTIPDIVPGPCKVEGTTVDGGRLVAVISATRDGRWTCFERGERSCR